MRFKAYRLSLLFLGSLLALIGGPRVSAPSSWSTELALTSLFSAVSAEDPSALAIFLVAGVRAV
jgi:hypothetical protein